MKALCITLNPALDTTYVVTSFEAGGSNRVIRKHETPGGKGNNVARILASRGHKVVATGFLGGVTGEMIARGLSSAGVSERFYRLPNGNSRACHAILDQSTAQVTEILEPGPSISRAEIGGFEALLGDLIENNRFDVITISGSTPPGVESQDLRRIGATIRRSNAFFVVDSSGPTLRTLVDCEPDLISPNRSELAEQMNDEVSAPDSLDRIEILLSDGRAGASLISRSGTFSASVPEFSVVNTVGCGDALLAGFLDAKFSAETELHPLARAVAFGSAAALQETAGVVDQGDIERFEVQVQLTPPSVKVGDT
jgi:1-phosphofructokinase family hexose kinase